MIKDLANQFGVSIFIETGTFKGYMLQGLMPYFARLYSVEIYEPLYAKALQIFKKYPKVRLILGDSAEQVPLLLKELSEPALFWLDGHYSGEGTGTAQEHSPILAELNNIFSHRVKNHILLIDDARFFTGKDGYPTLEALEKFVKENSTYQHFSVNDDLILIHA
ncbi:MAG: hypothetical protein EAZ55_01975 [Cytophagales bacterium]|nr:MAG: hypothetical protein EAZ55_01975 [Cytophagales bacterium]